MPIQVRQALVGDVPAIQKLVNSYAAKGLMLPRSLNSLYEHLRDYLVAEDTSEIVGCVALHISWKNLAEIRSLAVAQDAQGQSIGTLLVRHALAEAARLGVQRVFVLTFVKDFFYRLGFRELDKAELPHKIWQECVNCIHFPDCDEVALDIKL